MHGLAAAAYVAAALSATVVGNGSNQVQRQLLILQQKITCRDFWLQQYEDVTAGNAKALQKHSEKFQSG